MISRINNVLLRLSKRAESNARAALIQTFVDVGPLSTLLTATDHQIVYGRRGTGKTHAFAFLANIQESNGDVAVSVDLRNIGSSGGIYSDTTRDLTDRATCLLVDTLAAIHEQLYGYFLTCPTAPDLSQSGPAIDELADAITEVMVVGSVEREEHTSRSRTEGSNVDLAIDISTGLPTARASHSSEVRAGRQDIERVVRSGSERLHVNFGSTGAAFRRITDLLSPHRLWVLLDEWSSLPLDLQPYLADLLRRSLLPTSGITVKIAAIDQRSSFQLRHESSDYLGIEVGADAAADIDLDDFMVFDNDAKRAKSFFQDLICRHAQAIAAGTEYEKDIAVDSAELIRAAFTQTRAFEEFVRASEGVPRDAINILSTAAQLALEKQISVEHIRVAARKWYQRDKDKSVSANPTAHDLLHQIIDTVIGERRARAFLLQSGISHPLIDALHDARVLHVLKRNISTHDQPGIRYDVYKLDYGCYVDLIATSKEPLGLLPGEDDLGQGAYIEVPPDDYRSIRRAILDLSKISQVKEAKRRMQPTLFTFAADTERSTTHEQFNRGD